MIEEKCKLSKKTSKKIDMLMNDGAKISFENSEQIDLGVSNHDGGARFAHIILAGEKNVDIDLHNALITVKHLVTPFILDECENITLQNFSIRFLRHYYVQTKIISIEKNIVECEPLDIEMLSVENGILRVNYGDETLVYDDLFFVQEFENPFKVAKDANIAIYAGNEKKYFELKNQKLFFHTDKANEVHPGNYLCFFAQKRTTDAIVINKCKNIKIKNVNIYSSPAMGIACQISENIELDKVNVIHDGASSYQITSLADATHFFACRGKINMTRCIFENMNDDATNIHGIYEIFERIQGDEAIIIKKHVQQFGVNSFLAGDSIAILDYDTKILSEAKIIESIVIDKQRTRLKLDKKIYIDNGGIVENLSANPEIYIAHCKTGNNRPRGFLLASKGKTVIENCIFYNSECGIGAFADTDYWYESGRFDHIEIKNNIFLTNYGGGKGAIEVSPTVKYGGDYFNGVLIIKNNDLKKIYKKAVFVSNTKEVCLENNVCTAGSLSMEFVDCGKTVIQS